MDTYKEIFEKSNQKILDCFSGADNSFAKYLFAMRDIAQKADNDDQDAVELVRIIEKFARLIKILNGENIH